MSVDPPVMKLAALANVRSGYAFKSRDWATTGTPVVKIANIRPGVLDLNGCSFVDDDIAESASEYLLHCGDIVIAMTGYVGEVARVPAGIRLLQNQRVGKFDVTDSERLDPDYLYHFLRWEETKSVFVGKAHGSAQANISPSLLLSIEIPIHSLSEQRAIAEVLGALDDKIAANRRIASTAMDLADAQFRLSRKGGTEARLADVAMLNYGKALPQTVREPGSVLVYGSGGLVGRHSSALVDHPGIVVGRKGTVGAVYWAPGPHFPIDTTYSVVPKDHSVTDQYLFFALRAMKLESLNGDSAVPGLNRSEAYAQPLLVPDQREMEGFTSACSMLFDRIECAETENEKLATTRDGLLPLLMSGKLRVKDAEKQVGEVV